MKQADRAGPGGRYLGIDFSGGAAAWRERVRKPSVWIATAEITAEGPALVSLVPVQDLPGAGGCFNRLVSLLSRGDYIAAAIDAPFSLPSAHVPQGGHGALVDLVGALPDADDRSFPRGAALMALAEGVQEKESLKPLRTSENAWARQAVNTRSTLWNGPRGGAPFAVACLSLIARSGRPCWPWTRSGPGMLVEAFPAAQLRHWSLPHQRYAGEAGAETRNVIVAALKSRIALSSKDADAMSASPDALDAVIAVFAAIAAPTLLGAYPPEAELEGWIAVHP